MPTNESEPFGMYTLYGVPVFTYGMLGITTLVLAYVTFMDDGDGKSFANPNDQSSTFGEELSNDTDNKKEGQSEENSGQSEENSGQSEENPGQPEENPGQPEENPGQPEETPGQPENKEATQLKGGRKNNKTKRKRKN